VDGKEKPGVARQEIQNQSKGEREREDCNGRGRNFRRESHKKEGGEQEQRLGVFEGRP